MESKSIKRRKNVKAQTKGTGLMDEEKRNESLAKDFQKRIPLKHRHAKT